MVEKYDAMLHRVQAILTPKELLDKTVFDRPIAIHPKWHSSFDILLEERERIRHLELLPVKTDAMRTFYHAQPKAPLEKQVEKYLADAPITLSKNKFPDCLPPEVRQYIMWLSSYDIHHEQIAQFATNVMVRNDLTLDDVIFFERPKSAQTPLVRGSFQKYRHIHFWTREKDLIQ